MRLGVTMFVNGPSFFLLYVPRVFNYRLERTAHQVGRYSIVNRKCLMIKY